ncbi:hypothetical protein R3I93_019990 [Phoxinus phoxinus]|uniref:Uncharacterized protein n=1 Tax=Phoxinus phoxinus TaxID=58324 RepID=A0AAN9CE77_9TELE
MDDPVGDKADKHRWEWRHGGMTMHWRRNEELGDCWMRQERVGNHQLFSSLPKRPVQSIPTDWKKLLRPHLG